MCVTQETIEKPAEWNICSVTDKTNNPGYLKPYQGFTFQSPLQPWRVVFTSNTTQPRFPNSWVLVSFPSGPWVVRSKPPQHPLQEGELSSRYHLLRPWLADITLAALGMQCGWQTGLWKWKISTMDNCYITRLVLCLPWLRLSPSVSTYLPF